MAKTKYLLPCPCGQSTPVETVQAGQEIRCACGAALEVPTLQGLRSLPRAPAERVARTGASWGLRQQLLLLGAMITLAALLLGGYLHMYRPRLRDVDSLSILETVALWRELRIGVRYRSPYLAVLDENLVVHRRWLGVTGVIAAAGLLTLASSLLVPKKGVRKPLPKKEKPAVAKAQGPAPPHPEATG